MCCPELTLRASAPKLAGGHASDLSKHVSKVTLVGEAKLSRYFSQQTAPWQSTALPQKSVLQ